MIVSDVIKLKLKVPIDDCDIEKELSSLELNILRWAITKVEDDFVTLRIAYEKV